jgi:hypothetical protein
MKFFQISILSFILCVASTGLHAQKITGTWEGYMSREFIQINIVQKGNLLCGYTYDYELDNRSSHCIARFEGMYDPERKLWYLSGKSFIENSGSHVLMRIILRKDPYNAKNMLTANVYVQSFGGFSDADVFTIKKVSSKPQDAGGGTSFCFPKASAPSKPAVKLPAATPEKPKVTPKPSVTPKPAPEKPETPLVKAPEEKPVLKPQPPVSKADTLKKVTTPPVPITSLPDRDILRSMNARKKVEQNRLEVNVKKIFLKVYDNGVVDGDTVSIFYNGKLLLSHKRLSETPIELSIDLDERAPVNEITMYAENLGGIPPNTALIVVTAGGKRYELRSKASLEENAVLVIEYKPTQNE